MSEDVKKDLTKAIQSAQKNNDPAEKVVFPNPVVLQHSLDKGISFPSPSYRQNGKNGNND